MARDHDELYRLIDYVKHFRSATGESWQEIMLDCINKPEARCDPKSDDKGQLSQVNCIERTVIITISKFSSQVVFFINPIL